MNKVLKKLAKYDSFIKNTNLDKTTKLYGSDIKQALKFGNMPAAIHAGERAAEIINKSLGHKLVRQVIQDGDTIAFVVENGDIIKR